MHAGEVKLASLWIGAEKDGHLDDVLHIEALVFERRLDLCEDTGGLRFGVAVVSGGALGGVRRRDRAGKLPAQVIRIARPDAGGDGRFLGLHMFYDHLRRGEQSTCHYCSQPDSTHTLHCTSLLACLFRPIFIECSSRRERWLRHLPGPALRLSPGLRPVAQHAVHSAPRPPARRRCD